MNIDSSIKRKLKNAEGKRLLIKNRLEYCKIIIEEIQYNPDILDDLLNSLDIEEKDFFSYISGEKQANISFYDQTLKILKKKK